MLAAREVLGRNLEHGLFSALNLDLQAEICILLLEIGAQHPNTVSRMKFDKLLHGIANVSLDSTTLRGY